MQSTVLGGRASIGWQLRLTTPRPCGTMLGFTIKLVTPLNQVWYESTRSQASLCVPIV